MLLWLRLTCVVVVSARGVVCEKKLETASKDGVDKIQRKLDNITLKKKEK